MGEPSLFTGRMPFLTPNLPMMTAGVGLPDLFIIYYFIIYYLGTYTGHKEIA